jgi:hypothetical protein
MDLAKRTGLFTPSDWLLAAASPGRLSLKGKWVWGHAASGFGGLDQGYGLRLGGTLGDPGTKCAAELAMNNRKEERLKETLRIT